MKKFLKVVSIIMLVVNICILALCIVSLTKSEEVGKWIVNLYEEITNDVGHTVEGMYQRLAIITSICGILGMIFATVVAEVSVVYTCNHKEGAEVKPEETVEDSERSEKMARLTKEERLARREAKKEARRAAKAQKSAVQRIEESTEVVDKVIKGADQNAKSVNDFIANLKNRRR